MGICRSEFAPLLGVAFIGCGLLLATGNAVAKGTLTVFQVSGQATSVNGINDSGAITGGYGNGNTSGFLQTPDGTVTTFKVSGSIDTVGESINNKGVIAGMYDTDSRGWQPFIRKTDGKLLTFKVSGSIDTETMVVNDAGTVAGRFFDAGNTPHIFVRSTDGTVSTFDITDAWTISVSGINAGGSVVGSYDVGQVVHGFLLTPDGTVTTIDDPDSGGESVPTAINDDGVIVGWYSSGDGGFGFMRTTDGTYNTIDCPESGTSCGIYGVNNEQQMAGVSLLPVQDREVGFSQSSRGRTHIFRVRQGARYGIWPEKINATGSIAGWFWARNKAPKSGYRGLTTFGFLWVP